MFRKLRIVSLLLVLAGVGLGFWLERMRLAGWHDPVWVVLYPINADGTSAVDDYIGRLDEHDFESIEHYLRDAAEPYGLAADPPVRIKLAPPVSERPPAPPDGGLVAGMVWSLHLRGWAWWHDTFDGPGEIRLFVLLHEAREGRRLAHSLGLEKARIGVVHAFADRRYSGRNNVVIAHELLHTLGAQDHYDRATGEPIHPEGFAAPDRVPRYPQDRAALMGARIPLAPGRSRMPRSLAETVVAPATAAEIGWRSTAATGD